MPLVEAELEKASDAKHFTNFDLIHGYCQLLLHTNSQECQLFIKPDGILTPRHVLHGNVNSNSHLNSGFMTKMSDEIKRRLLLWVDEVALACHTIDELLRHIRKLVDLCMHLKLKNHPLNCRIYKKPSYGVDVI